MNNGFKGGNIRIEKMEVRGTAGGESASIHAAIQFVSDEGTVHAVARHELPVFAPQGAEDPDGLYGLLQELVKVVTTRLEQLHFSQPKSAAAAVGETRGIAEALSGATATSDEPKARQG